MINKEDVTNLINDLFLTVNHTQILIGFRKFLIWTFNILKSNEFTKGNSGLDFI